MDNNLYENYSNIIHQAFNLSSSIVFSLVIIPVFFTKSRLLQILNQQLSIFVIIIFMETGQSFSYRVQLFSCRLTDSLHDGTAALVSS